MENERNIANNSRQIGIEVIDEKTNIALVSNMLHPDLGALKKAINTNKKNAVDIVTIDQYKNNLNDFQLVILYQPTIKFKNALDELNKFYNEFGIGQVAALNTTLYGTLNNLTASQLDLRTSRQTIVDGNITFIL
mgnify:CR=1 FL=1